MHHMPALSRSGTSSSSRALQLHQLQVSASRPGTQQQSRPTTQQLTERPGTKSSVRTLGTTVPQPPGTARGGERRMTAASNADCLPSVGAATRRKGAVMDVVRCNIGQMLDEPQTFGSVPMLLMEAYNTVVAARAHDGSALASNFFDQLAGDSAAMIELRSAKRTAETMRRTIEALEHEVGELRMDIRAQDLEKETVERTMRQLENAEQEASQRASGCEEKLTAVTKDCSAERLKVQQLQQQLRAALQADEHRFVARTADMRQQIETMRDQIRVHEEQAKFAERELVSIKQSLDDAERQLTDAHTELDETQDTVVRRDTELEQLKRVLADRDATIERQSQRIAALQLDLGHSRTRRVICAEDPRWAAVAEAVAARVAASASECAVPAKAVAMSDSRDIPSCFRHKGKLKLKPLTGHATCVIMFHALAGATAHMSTSYNADLSLATSSASAALLQAMLPGYKFDSKKAVAACCSVRNAMTHWSSRALVRFVSASLEGRFPPQIFAEVGLECADQFLAECVKLDTQRLLTVPASSIADILRAVFTRHPPHLARPSDTRRLQLLIAASDNDAPAVRYTELFEVGEGGAVSPFVEGLFELLLAITEGYYTKVCGCFESAFAELNERSVSVPLLSDPTSPPSPSASGEVPLNTAATPAPDAEESSKSAASGSPKSNAGPDGDPGDLRVSVGTQPALLGLVSTKWTELDPGRSFAPQSEHREVLEQVVASAVQDGEVHLSRCLRAVRSQLLYRLAAVDDTWDSAPLAEFEREPDPASDCDASSRAATDVWSPTMTTPPAVDFAGAAAANDAARATGSTPLTPQRPPLDDDVVVPARLQPLRNVSAAAIFARSVAGRVVPTLPPGIAISVRDPPDWAAGTTGRC